MDASMSRPAVTAFVLDQLHELSSEARELERLATGGADAAATAEALDRLRHRLAAHVLVLERLLVAPLRGSLGYRALLTLEGEHDALGHRAVEVLARGCAAREVAALARALRAHVGEESRLVRSASAAAGRCLVGVPPWRADEYFECAGGPTGSWPGEWLG
jgi:hypothetical protein